MPPPVPWNFPPIAERRIAVRVPAARRPGRLSVAMRAELRSSTPQIAYVLELALPGGSRYFSDLGAHFGGGLVEDRVLSWGAIERGVTDRQNALELLSTQTVLDDTDQELASVIEGGSANAVRGSAARYWLASPRVARADWYLRFAGRLDAATQVAGPLTWTISVATLDLPLRRESAPKAKISRADWPNADPAVVDLPVPIAYGLESSAGGTNRGAVKCLYVDRSGFRYMPCGGRASAVTAVRKDGVGVASSAYAVTYPVVNGRIYTLVDFTSDQGTAAITCDLRGYDSAADGSGSLLTNPARVAAHLLRNWIFGDYRSGPWIETGVVDAASVERVARYFSQGSTAAAQASVYVGTRRKGLDILNDLLSSWEMKAYWTADGMIALALEDWGDFEYVEDYVLHEGEMQGWNLDKQTASLADEIVAKYALAPADGSYGQELRVKDLGTGEEAPESLSLPFSPSFITG